MNSVLAWLESTSIATWTRTSPSLWAYPTILTLHTVGLGIVVGASAVLDLRLLGVARRIALPSLTPLFPIIWWAFSLNAATGVILFMSDATTKGKQLVFLIKLVLIALALLNTVLVKRVVWRDPAGAAADARAQRLAVISLLLWTGAITAGRLMAYL